MYKLNGSNLIRNGLDEEASTNEAPHSLYLDVTGHKADLRI